MDRVTIATRESALAMWQSRHIGELLRNYYPSLEVELLGMTTSGDKMLSSSLSKIGGKGLFVKELEQALADDRADIAVHSAKDVPMKLPDGMRLLIVDKRADPRDALVLPVSNSFRQSTSIDSIGELQSILPSKAVLGTSSLRRQATIKFQLDKSALQIKELRGNLQTRLAKLDEGSFDAIVLAAAGLDRLDLQGRITARLGTAIMLPAVAQGALAIEYREDKREIIERLFGPLIHRPTTICVEAERACNYLLEGSCQSPIAIHAELENQQDSGEYMSLLRIRGQVLASDGGARIFEEALTTISNKSDMPEAVDASRALGRQLARQLLDRGARQLMVSIDKEQHV